MKTNWTLPGPFSMARGLSALLVGLLLGLLSSGAQAYLLRFEPVTQNVALGQKASVVVRVEGVRPGGLGNYDFEVAFDPAVLSFDSAIDAFGLGAGFGLLAVPGVPGVPGAGSVALTDVSLEDPADLRDLQPDDFDLLTLVFDTVAPGTSALTLRAVTLGDAEGTAVDAVTEVGSITVDPRQVPEPGSAALAALALALGIAGHLRSVSRRATVCPARTDRACNRLA
ncbi:MAG: hypothetical protein IPM99_18115 [Rubrivivax sp.]|nr:hypothetical protein [Rubrivivax sp.]